MIAEGVETTRVEELRAVCRSFDSEELFKQLEIFGRVGGFFHLWVGPIGAEKPVRIPREAYLAEFCFFDFAIWFRAHSSRNCVFAIVFPSLLLKEGSFDLRRFGPEIFQTVDHPRIEFVCEFAIRFPAALFG